ncbi:AraC family transcriptional regulator [Spirosoma sp. KNUC1025]|uniref:AraC family transcriptional regulator n=1 Tax=Spirosoma sp. KNUC1025 TaxID=2894082 RepID=UPI003870E461|nr:AraC family transcriptional regulator [Spirosoma sp. KNUC1025]
MILDHKQYDLFGKTLIRKIVLEPPFRFTFPLADYACFLYILKGDIQYNLDEEKVAVPVKHSLLLHCLDVSTEIGNPAPGSHNELVIVHFHPDILKEIYNRELPALLQPTQRKVSNQSRDVINNDFLIQKYMEGLLFYFENPSLVNEDILVLKLKEIVLLLSQTRNAEAVHVILSQLFSPAAYSFKQIIEANLFSHITLDELAQQTNMSLSSFKREFAKLYNDTPANYLKYKKLERAAELLRVSEERISDIAFSCGFHDLANFSKSFADTYKLSPTAYRLNGIAK